MAQTERRLTDGERATIWFALLASQAKGEQASEVLPRIASDMELPLELVEQCYTNLTMEQLVTEVNREETEDSVHTDYVEVVVDQEERIKQLEARIETLEGVVAQLQSLLPRRKRRQIKKG